MPWQYHNFNIDSKKWQIVVGSDRIVAAIAIALIKGALVFTFKHVSDGPMDPAIALVHSLMQYAYVTKPD